MVEFRRGRKPPLEHMHQSCRSSGAYEQY